MIWIQSCDNDLSTQMVIDWLDYYNKPWIRTNNKRIVFNHIILNNEKSNFILEYENVKGNRVNISSKLLTAYWYRRGELTFGYNAITTTEEELGVCNYLQQESNTIKENINHILKEIKHINNFSDNSINKMNVLIEAQKVGLLIPETH